MKKHILLPTDFSDNAWSAAVYALKLFTNEECTFYFLHSTKMRVSTMSPMTNKLLEHMSKTALKDLKELKEMAEIAYNLPFSDEILEKLEILNKQIHNIETDLNELEKMVRVNRAYLN